MTNKTPLEIERKWMVNGFPDLPLLFSQQMRQGYIATHPTVRIREEKMIYSSKHILLIIPFHNRLNSIFYQLINQT